jgi:hypothetical protein
MGLYRAALAIRHPINMFVPLVYAVKALSPMALSVRWGKMKSYADLHA